MKRLALISFGDNLLRTTQGGNIVALRYDGIKTFGDNRCHAFVHIV